MKIMKRIVTQVDVKPLLSFDLAAIIAHYKLTEGLRDGSTKTGFVSVNYNELIGGEENASSRSLKLETPRL